MTVKIEPRTLYTMGTDFSEWLVVEETVAGRDVLLSHWRTRSEAVRAVERYREEHVLGRDG